MKIEIEYCAAWNYKPRAASLAAELKDALGVDSKLVASGGGVFEITVDGKLVFSKAKLDRFPNDGEVLEKIRAL